MPAPLRPVPDQPGGPGEEADATPGPRPAGDPARAGAGEELLARTALGETAAFEALYRLFAPRVYGIALRVVRDPGQAEEVAQEVFLELWRRASRFDPARGSAAGWVATLAHARAVDRVRAAQAAADREDRAGRAGFERAVDAVADTVEHRFERRAVGRCLDTLTDVQRRSVTLAYYHGYSYPQVAGLLHITLPAVKTRMRDGLIRLRDCLKVSQ